jgi:hypothetical protein
MEITKLYTYTDIGFRQTYSMWFGLELDTRTSLEKVYSVRNNPLHDCTSLKAPIREASYVTGQRTELEQQQDFMTQAAGESLLLVLAFSAAPSRPATTSLETRQPPPIGPSDKQLFALIFGGAQFESRPEHLLL